jgi:hypothetical protein
MQYGKERCEMCTKFSSENLKGGDHLEDLRIMEDNITQSVTLEVGWKGVD